MRQMSFAPRLRVSCEERKHIRPPLTFVDMFCGCGGLSLGFLQAGFRPLFGVDMNEPATQTYARNIEADVWCGRIEDFVAELESGNIDLRARASLHWGRCRRAARVSVSTTR